MGFYSSLTLRDFPIDDLRSLRDKSQQDKSQFVSIWQFLIYIELAKLLLQDNTISSNSVLNEVKDFLNENHLNSSLGFSETLREITQTEGKVTIGPKWLGGEYANSSVTEKNISIHYNKVVKILEEKFKQLNTNFEFWIFIDELDEGYRAGDKNKRLLLLSLLRSVENTALAIGRYIKYRPLLVLRSDIFDSLEDNDLNKLDDYIIRLKWSSEDVNSINGSNTYALKDVILARIQSSIPQNKSTDLWGEIVEDKDQYLPRNVKSIWKYMANRTYERPRDIIKFLKICRNNFQGNRNKLSFKEVLKAEIEYSNWLYNELKDEIHPSLPCWQKVFNCLTNIGRGRFSKSELEGILQKDTDVNKWMAENSKNADDIIELLFNFGIVGNLDGRRWLFKYKDEDLSWSQGMELIIHYGLHKKLRIKSNSNMGRRDSWQA